jgi:hypothetical protein
MTRSRASRCWLGLAIAAPLAGCTATSAPPAAAPLARASDAPARPSLAEAPFGDLVEQWTSTPGNLYVRRPRPDFAAYQALLFEPAAILYDARSVVPQRRDHERLAGALLEFTRESTLAALRLPEANAPGSGVLRVRTEVSGLDFDSSINNNSRVTSIIQPGGDALYVLELADAESGTPLLRVAVSRSMPGGIFTGPWSPELDRARQLFRAFGLDAQETLGVVFGRLRPPAG